MKVVSWSQYKMRRQAQLNGGYGMPLSADAPAGREPHAKGSAAHADRIRMDCLQRYVKAQLRARSTTSVSSRAPK
jgi:hypothetical protein